MLTKKRVGSILGFMSLLPLIISFIIFYIERGPNADVYLLINVGGISAIIGILFAVLSWVMAKRLFIPIIGILANSFILVYVFLLLLAMGISEP